jgi:hypothetical protein
MRTYSVPPVHWPLCSFKNLEGQATHQIQHLQEYKFTYKNHQGQKHNNADALIWRPYREECIHSHKVYAWADVKQVQGIVAVATVGWDPATLRREQLNNQDIWPILEEVETRQDPE